MLPQEAPDPRLQMNARLRDLHFPLMSLAPQPSVEDIGAVNINEGTDAESLIASLSVRFSYTLRRNPADRADPVNLAALDERTLAALDEPPSWPRPAWLLELAQKMRYPLLWEALRTTWNRDLSEHTTLPRQLVDHTNHVLRNRFRDELQITHGRISDPAWAVKESAVDTAATLDIDGAETPAVQIDTDPLVYAIGAQLLPHVATSVVVAREDLPHIRLALTARTTAPNRTSELRLGIRFRTSGDGPPSLVRSLPHWDHLVVAAAGLVARVSRPRTADTR